MTEEEIGQCMGVRGHVEGLIRADSCVGAGGDVADGITTGFPGCNADGCESPHDGGCVVNMDKMELEVLPGGDVCDSIGVFFGEFCHHLSLATVHSTVGDFDAQHAGGIPDGIRAFCQIAARVVEILGFQAVIAVAVIVTLPVSTSTQPSFSEDPLTDLFPVLPTVNPKGYRFIKDRVESGARC